MCAAELLWRGAYTRQSVEIKPNFRVLPHYPDSHMKLKFIMVLFIILYIITLLTKHLDRQSQGAPGCLGQSGWHRPVALLPGWHRSCCLQGREDPRRPRLGDTAPWPAVMPSVVGVAGCWLLSCSWGETPSWKTWHSCAMEAEACHCVWRNFGRGYMGRAFSVWSHQMYWCQQLSDIWASWRGMSCAKERWVEGRGTQSPGGFVLWRRDGWVLQLHVCSGDLWYSKVF